MMGHFLLLIPVKCFGDVQNCVLEFLIDFFFNFMNKKLMKSWFFSLCWSIYVQYKVLFHLIE